MRNVVITCAALLMASMTILAGRAQTPASDSPEQGIVEDALQSQDPAAEPAVPQEPVADSFDQGLEEAPPAVSEQDEMVGAPLPPEGEQVAAPEPLQTEAPEPRVTPQANDLVVDEAPMAHYGECPVCHRDRRHCKCGALWGSGYNSYGSYGRYGGGGSSLGWVGIGLGAAGLAVGIAANDDDERIIIQRVASPFTP